MQRTNQVSYKINDGMNCAFYSIITLVRKMKLAEATMKPGRRSGLRRSGGCSSRPLERPYGGCKSINDNSIMTPLLFLLAKLMKRTLKMAKERYSLSIISKTRYKYTANLYRNHMMTFKPAGK